MDDYQYKSLDTQNSSIRLLRLRKGNTVQVRCDIFHASIHDYNAPSYEALSYTWGSSDLVDSIEVDGKTLWITENLYSALLCLRLQDRDRVLWIDAVCINQADPIERGQQVLHMGEIYSSAERVIFWLGKPTADATLLMKLLGDLQVKSSTMTQQDKISFDFDWEAMWSKLLLQVEPQYDTLRTRLQNGLQTLVVRPWFGRVWVLQEVFNAQSAIVCSGTLSVAADIFALAPSLLDWITPSHVQAVLDIVPKGASVRAQDCQNRSALIDLLLKFRASKATDERDMYYALLCMSSDPFDHVLLQPNYTKSLPEIIHNMVRYWLESTTVSIQRICRFLAGLEGVRATYLVLPQEATKVGVKMEKVHIPSPAGLHSTVFMESSETWWEPVMCNRSSSYLLIEPASEKTSKLQSTTADELDRLQEKLSGDHDAVRVISWLNSPRNLRFIVVEKQKRAYLKLTSLNCWKTLSFVANNSIDKLEILSYGLLRAVVSKDEAAVRSFLNLGTNVNFVEGQESVLQAACFEGHIPILQMLLKRNLDINAQVGYHGTALQAASARGHTEIVQLLLAKGTDVNAQNNQGHCSTALQAAVAGGHTDTARLLLQHGADVNARGVSGTALQLASMNKHVSMEELLLEYGAKRDLGMSTLAKKLPFFDRSK